MLSLKWKNLMKALVRWATINTDSFDVVAGDFANQDSATISANDVSISADSFVNSHTLGYGSIIVDKLTLSLIEDFNYAADYLNNGNIEATTLKVILRDE